MSAPSQKARNIVRAARAARAEHHQGVVDGPCRGCQRQFARALHRLGEADADGVGLTHEELLVLSSCVAWMDRGGPQPESLRSIDVDEVAS